jgi:hypothetical protein
VTAPKPAKRSPRSTVETGQLLYNLTDAGRQLGGVSVDTVRRLLTAGELEAVTVAPNGSTRPRRMVTRDSLDRYVARLADPPASKRRTRGGG